MKSGIERRLEHKDQPETEEKTMRKERKKEVERERGEDIFSTVGKLCGPNFLKSES